MDEVELEKHLLAVFFVESAEMLNEASFALLKAEAACNPAEAINQVFRAIHSIKGGAQSLGFEQLADVAHHMEDFMVPFRHDEHEIDGQIVSLILESMDVIESQLTAYQRGEIAPNATEFLAKLEGKALSISSAQDNESNKVIDSQKNKTINSNSRLLYLSFSIDPLAIMPSIVAFMFVDRLRNSGKLLYSKPDIDNSSTIGDGEVFVQVAIVESDMSYEVIKQEAYSVGDIRELKISVIDNNSFSTVAMPTQEEIGELNKLVAMMWEALGNENNKKGYIDELARKITGWGITSSGSAEWFPGALSNWERVTALLVEALSLKESCNVSGRKQSIACNILRALWETAYDALRDKIYFHRVIASDMLFKNGLQVVTELEKRAGNLQCMIIDLSSWEVLEAEQLHVLAQINSKIVENGRELRLVSEGKYTRRHVNVLEIAKKNIGQLELYPSIYSAVITKEHCN